MERRNVLQSILNITSKFPIRAKDEYQSPQPRDLPQPRLSLGVTPKIFRRLLATGLPKSISRRLNKLYHVRADKLQEIVKDQLATMWASLTQKSTLEEKLLKARYKLLAGAIIRQLKDGRLRLVEVVIDAARCHAEEIRLQPKPKWNKKFVPIFEWVFEHSFGQYPTTDERRRLAQASGLSYRQIVVWFQNRRARTKKRLLAELAAVERGDNPHESLQTAPFPPSFIRTLRRDSRIRPRRFLMEHLHALAPKGDYQSPSAQDTAPTVTQPEASGSGNTGDPNTSTNAQDDDSWLYDEFPNDGWLPSLSDMIEKEICDEFLNGVRINPLDTVVPTEWSFPKPMVHRIYSPLPPFGPTEFPRNALQEEKFFIPVDRADLQVLYEEVQGLHITPPPLDAILTSLCGEYDTMKLDAPGLGPDTESSADRYIADLDLDSPFSPPGDTITPPSSPKLRTEEESRRILRMGVGKVRLVRQNKGSSRVINCMAPPLVTRPKPPKLAVAKNIFNGRRAKVPKRRLPVVRDLPSSCSSVSTNSNSSEDSNKGNVSGSSGEPNLGQGAEIVGDLFSEHGSDSDYEEYLEAVEDGDDEEYFQDQLFESLEQTQAPKDASTIVLPSISFECFDFGAITDPSDDSWSGSSHVDSDLEDVAMACMPNVPLSLIEPHEVLEPPGEIELPECFLIPYDPEIAEIALKETLVAFNIPANPYHPVQDMNALDLQTWRIDFGEEHKVEIGDTMKAVDLASWNTDFYSEEATMEPQVVDITPTYVEQYLSNLPLLTEDASHQSHADFVALQAAIAARMQESGLEPRTDDIDLLDPSFLSEPPTLQPSTIYPAFFLPVLPDLYAGPETQAQAQVEPDPKPDPINTKPIAQPAIVDDYGDGSQFLVDFGDEPSGESFLPIFTDDDFLPESERYQRGASIPFECHVPGLDYEFHPFITINPPPALYGTSWDSGAISDQSVHSLVQPVPHLPSTSLVDSSGIGAPAEQSSSSAQSLIDFILSFPTSLVSSVTSLVGSGSKTVSTKSKPTPDAQQPSPINFSDTEDFKREITEYANLRVYGTTTSPYDDPNPPALW